MRREALRSTALTRPARAATRRGAPGSPRARRTAWSTAADGGTASLYANSNAPSRSTSRTAGSTPSGRSSAASTASQACAAAGRRRTPAGGPAPCSHGSSRSRLASPARARSAYAPSETRRSTRKATRRSGVAPGGGHAVSRTVREVESAPPSAEERRRLHPAAVRGLQLEDLDRAVGAREQQPAVLDSQLPPAAAACRSPVRAVQTLNRSPSTRQAAPMCGESARIRLTTSTAVREGSRTMSSPPILGASDTPSSGWGVVTSRPAVERRRGPGRAAPRPGRRGARAAIRRRPRARPASGRSR